MTGYLPDSDPVGVAQLVASVALLHEVSRHDELIPEIPRCLRTVFGASGVAVVLVGVTATGAEAAREAYAAGLFRDAGQVSADWVADLLTTRSTSHAAGDAEPRVVRFGNDGRIQTLFDLNPQRVVAFQIQTPAASFSLHEQGREWALKMLGLLARNLRRCIDRPSAGERAIPPVNALTPGEWRVLLAIDSDALEKEIAPKLSMSGNTLHSHIKSIYQMLRVRSRLGAVSVLHRAQRQAILQELLALHAHHPESRHALERQAAGGDAAHSGAAESSPEFRSACGS